MTATRFEPQPFSSQTNTQPFSQTGQVWRNGSVFLYELSGCGFKPVVFRLPTGKKHLQIQLQRLRKL